jgi:hypothetical protein
MQATHCVPYTEVFPGTATRGPDFPSSEQQEDYLQIDVQTCD